MSDSERKQAEKQAKIYLAVLASLLVVAIMVTMFTLYRQEIPSAEAEDAQEAPQGQSVEAEIQEPQEIQQDQQETEAVQHNLNEANSRIQNESKPVEHKQDNSLFQKNGSVETKVMGEEKTEPTETISEQMNDIEEGSLQEEFAAEPQNMTAAFDPAEDLMVWPVSGVVLMDYSSDALIYDRTLDLYRTNDSISIGAEEAEDVLAAADGIVTDIGRSDTLGNYVVLDNGSGYETTYGQLSEDVAVVVGEYVDQGEVLGCIDAPSWYSSALGTHLTFTVRVNGATVNPLEFLENVLEEE